MNPTVVRILNALYKIAQAIPLVALLLGLSAGGTKLLLGVDFLVGVGLASVLDLPEPAPPAEVKAP